MSSLPIELDLPLGDSETDELESRRQGHIADLPGVDPTAARRLTTRFGSLADVYAASEERLAAAVGPVAAARIRWFLDAPLGAPAARRRPGWRQVA
jgi:ERCC4-type nuclease